MATMSAGAMNSPASSDSPGTKPALENREIFSGMRWTGVGQIMVESVRLLISVVLARLLAPEDFGLLSMASVLTSFVMIFQYLGTAGAVVQRPQMSDRLVHTLFLLNMIVSLVLTVGLVLSAGPLAGIYNEPRLIPIIQVFGLTFVLGAAQAVPSALLTRRLQFSAIAKVTFLGAVVQGVVAIVMAKMGYGVWALVWSNIISSAVVTIATMRVARWLPQWVFDIPELKTVLAFCLNLTGSSIVDFVSRDADKFLIGKWLGERDLGYYTMTNRFALYPPLSISPIINRVIFPAFARIQDDHEQVATIFRRSVGGIAFVTFPLILGLVALARPFVYATIGAKWETSIPLFALMAPIGILQAIVTPANYVVFAKGKTGVMLMLTTLSAAVTLASMYIGHHWGLTGAVLAYSLATIPMTALRFWFAFRVINFHPLLMLRDLFPYALASTIMFVLVYGLMKLMGMTPVPDLVRVIVGVATGVVSYVAMMAYLEPPAVRDLRSLLPARLRPMFDQLMRKRGDPGK